VTWSVQVCIETHSISTVFGGHLVNFEIDFIVSDIFAEKVVDEVDAWQSKINSQQL
jgi:hypothetical protein